MEKELNPIIKFDYINVKFPSSNKYYNYEGKVEIFKNDFSLFYGESGCGKSTILKILTGLIPFYEFAKVKSDLEIKQNKVFIAKISNFNNNIIKKNYSPIYLFQNPYTQIVAPYVKNELVFPLENKIIDKDFIKKSYHEIVKEFNLYDYLERKTFELSGGEIQKIQIASLLTIDPEIIFLDEPTSFLDIKYKNYIHQIFYKLKGKKTVIIIEHDFIDILDIFNNFITIEKLYENNNEIKYSIYQINNKKDFIDFINKTQNKKNSFLINIEQKFELISKLNNKKDKRINYNSNLLEINNLYFSYKIKKLRKFNKLKKEDFLLKNINLKINNETIVIFGNNGSGKTTLLKLIAKIIKPSYGKIINNSNNISIVFQNPETHFLYPTINKEIESYIKNSINKKNNKNLKEEIISKFSNIIEFENYLFKSPFELSEGEKRRFTLLLAIFSQSDLLLLDEPTFGQDFIHREIIKRFIKYLKQIGKSIIIVTHDLEFGEIVGDRFFLLEKGELKEFNKNELYIIKNKLLN